MTTPWAARLAVIRFLVGAYVAGWIVLRSPHLLDTLDLTERRFDPIGPLWFLESPVTSWVVVVAIVVTPIAALAMALDRRLVMSAPLAAIGFLFLTTYRNSWGQLFHTENLVALHLIVLAVAAVIDGQSERDEEAAWVVRSMAVMTVFTYAVAGIAKLRISGWDWVDGDVLRHQVAYDNARKHLLGDPMGPLAEPFLRQAWLLGPSAVMTMVVELAAPLALVHRRVAAWWAAAALGFHVAILGIMAIVFPYHLLGLALAPLLPVERLGATVDGWRSRFRTPRRTALPAG